ncbi:hypothetical protein [Thermosulfuriphilus sp.]
MKARIPIKEIDEAGRSVAVKVRKEVVFSCEACDRFEFGKDGQCIHWGRSKCPLLSAFLLISSLGLERLPRA